MADTSSLQERFFQEHARCSADVVDRVLLNDTYEVSRFESKAGRGTAAEILYNIPDHLGIDEITNIKLLDIHGDVLSNAPVYIPVAGRMTLRHVIEHKEVASNG